MSGRDRVRLSAGEVADFLGSQTKVQVATNGAHGAPHLTTLFYVLEQGRIAFWTYASSQKVQNLRRDPRVACLVEDGAAYDELRGVSITGTAELRTAPEDVARIGGRVVAAMSGVADLAELGPEAADVVARQARKRVAVVVRPEHVASWDHRKIDQERQTR